MESRTNAIESRTTDIIADLHARHEAWRRQGEDLARLQADARAEAGREAAAILDAARADISRILVDARSALVVLTAQLNAIPESARGRAGEESEDGIPESVLQARRDLQRLMDDVRPELDDLAAQAARFVTPVARTEPPVGRAEPVARAEPATAPAEPPAAPVEPPTAPAPILSAADPAPSSRPWWRFAIAFVLVAATFAGAGGWWVWSGLEDLTPPIASIPPAPRMAPSWFDEPIPTLSASLVGAPAAAAKPSQSSDAPDPAPRRP